MAKGRYQRGLPDRVGCIEVESAKGNLLVARNDARFDHHLANIYDHSFFTS